MEDGDKLLNQPIDLPEILCWCKVFVQLISGLLEVPGVIQGRWLLNRFHILQEIQGDT